MANHTLKYSLTEGASAESLTSAGSLGAATLAATLAAIPEWNESIKTLEELLEPATTTSHVPTKAMSHLSPSAVDFVTEVICRYAQGLASIHSGLDADGSSPEPLYRQHGLDWGQAVSFLNESRAALQKSSEARMSRLSKLSRDSAMEGSDRSAEVKTKCSGEDREGAGSWHSAFKSLAELGSQYRLCPTPDGRGVVVPLGNEGQVESSEVPEKRKSICARVRKVFSEMRKGNVGSLRQTVEVEDGTQVRGAEEIKAEHISLLAKHAEVVAAMLRNVADETVSCTPTIALEQIHEEVAAPVIAQERAELARAEVSLLTGSVSLLQRVTEEDAEADLRSLQDMRYPFTDQHQWRIALIEALGAMTLAESGVDKALDVTVKQSDDAKHGTGLAAAMAAMRKETALVNAAREKVYELAGLKGELADRNNNWMLQ